MEKLRVFLIDPARVQDALWAAKQTAALYASASKVPAPQTVQRENLLLERRAVGAVRALERALASAAGSGQTSNRGRPRS